MAFNFSKTMAAATLPLIAISSIICAANSARVQGCEPTPPVACNQEECCRTFCMGPENYGVNAPVRPRTCDGDWVIQLAGFYWNSHQDGMEYAVTSDTVHSAETFNRLQLLGARYENPQFNWDFGFKLGLGYNTTCDGWDFGVTWTWYKGNADAHIEAEDDDNTSITLLWSNFIGDGDPPILATDVKAQWDLDLNLIDVDLGREFWVSKRLSLRPHAGIRIAYLDQTYRIQHKGGVFSESTPRLNDVVQTKNDFNAVGVRAGLDTVWQLGCGWAIYNDLAVSMLYGRFDVNQKEFTREATAPFNKSTILDTTESFRASRLATDLALGIQWSALFCDCQYAFAARLGWEHHLFLDQNQTWRVPLNGNNGNTFFKNAGDLDTQGWTLSFTFGF